MFFPDDEAHPGNIKQILLSKKHHLNNREHPPHQEVDLIQFKITAIETSGYISKQEHNLGFMTTA